MTTRRRLLATGAAAYGLIATGLAGPASARSLPDSAAGRMLAAFLEVINTADTARISAFQAETGMRMGPEQILGLRAATGGMDLLEIEQEEPLRIVALLREKEGDTVARLTLVVTAATPARIETSSLQRIPTPPGHLPKRVGLSEAIALTRSRAADLAGRDLFAGVMAVQSGGAVVLEGGWGLADREAKIPARFDGRFRIGSMGKMFTAVAALQLVGKGLLDLDAPIGRYLTEYPDADVAGRVTARHLLTHSGGTGDIFTPEYEARRTEIRTLSDYVTLFGMRGVEGEPGKAFNYSNYGFILLGLLIERCSGRSYYEVVETEVFRPAGMTRTGSEPETSGVANLARSYMNPDGVLRDAGPTLPWRGSSAGGGYSTASDLLAFARALRNHVLLPADLMRQATTMQLPMPFRPNAGYGMGFEILGEGRLQSFGHGGGAPGMNGMLKIFPALDVVTVTLANLDPPAAERVSDFFTSRMPG